LIRNARRRDLYKNNKAYRVEQVLRARIVKVIKNNSKLESTVILLGCSIDNFKIHLENKFKKGMTWNNHSLEGWHIDHIKPCAKFDLSKKTEQRKCFNYTNLQPLWAKENLSKSAKY